MALLNGSAIATLAPNVIAVIEGRDAGRTVVWLRGEHDVATVSAVSATMAKAIAIDDSDVVVDLSGVLFMGAATVGVLARSAEFLRQRSRSLMLRSPSKSAARVLQLCGIADAELSEMGASGATALRTWVAVPAATRIDPGGP